MKSENRVTFYLHINHSNYFVPCIHFHINFHRIAKKAAKNWFHFPIPSGCRLDFSLQFSWRLIGTKGSLSSNYCRGNFSFRAITARRLSHWTAQQCRQMDEFNNCIIGEGKKRRKKRARESAINFSSSILRRRFDNWIPFCLSGFCGAGIDFRRISGFRGSRAVFIGNWVVWRIRD